MREMIRLFVVIFIFSAASGILLTVLYTGTEARIEYQELKFIKGPAIKQTLKGSSNDPLVTRFDLMDEKEKREFYVGIFDGKPKAVALETFGKGYDDEIGVIVAINVEDGKILGIGVTTNKETPGVGKRIETDMPFRDQFKGLSVETPIKLRKDGGQIDAISGASFSSGGVVEAVESAEEIYNRLKPEILQKLKAFKS
jgi:electron transport complex protein RnfG